MRLWHESLLSELSSRRLLSQHRECCALRGKGWNRKHSVVDYVFKHPFEYLVAYHHKVMNEMIMRGYYPNTIWYAYSYRGDKTPRKEDVDNHIFSLAFDKIPTYPEHNDEYLDFCKKLLIQKGDKR